ncbi:hypothetical protein LguiA_014838 [Lonicera macranthoides]
MASLDRNPIPFQFSSVGENKDIVPSQQRQAGKQNYNLCLSQITSLCLKPNFRNVTLDLRQGATRTALVKCSHSQSRQTLINSTAVDKKTKKKAGNQEHHLWSKRDSSGSGHKALNLVQIVCGLPNEKEAVYGALDKWTAWETEFPLIAVSKALQILRKRNQWTRVIQVAKWMFGKGQGMTMGTFDTLLQAFDMDQRVDEAESLWKMILHTHMRSISKRLFSRMVSLYAHHSMPEKIIEVFGDMEELGVKPDEDTVRKIANAFKKLGQEDKQKLFLKKYQIRWKYIHFNGERVRVRTNPGKN